MGKFKEHNRFKKCKDMHGVEKVAREDSLPPPKILELEATRQNVQQYIRGSISLPEQQDLAAITHTGDIETGLL